MLLKSKPLITLFSLLFLCLTQVTATAAEQVSSQQSNTTEQITEELTEEQKYAQWAMQIWESLDRQTGEISVIKNVATVTVPEDFYFLNAADSKKVLVDVWGNPPGSNVLGMLFPAQSTPFDSDSWAVTIEYTEDGYVSDEDADEIDYNELLAQMQEDTLAASKERVSQGYDSIALVGWAAPPYYDKAEHKLHWAKEIKFGSQPTNTLNYNIRVLGRKGVLVLNFIATIDQKTLIDGQLDNVLAMADFNEGSSYDDFNPDIDDVATYGLGALVAGKVIAKTGFLAALILFLKKFGVIIVIAIGGILKKVFSRKKKSNIEEQV